MAVRIAREASKLKASVSALAWLVAMCAPVVARAQDTVSVAAGEEQNSKARQPSTEEASDDIIVTGTNIRGGPASASLAVISRDDMEKGGFLDIGQALRSLPVNFSGGINAETQIAAGPYDNASLNSSYAASPNLRGLGSSATLTLLNGNRLPLVGRGISVDLSLLPTAAIERIDVLADGSSAIYGADAVAGVVNVVTKQDYDGLETRARYGSAKGGLGTYSGSILAGGHLGDLSAVASVEYFHQNHLDASERPESSLLLPPFTILPDTKRFSGYGSLKYNLSSSAHLFLDGLYSKNNSDTVFGTAASHSTRDIDSEQYSIIGGFETKIGDSWSASVTGVLDRNNLNYPTVVTTAKGVKSTAFTDRQSDLRSAEVRASGDLLNLPGGALDIAVGAAYREERISSNNAPLYKGERHISSIFGEANIPIVGSESRIPLISDLSLNVAGRYDDYSDVGSVFVPKIGLIWKVTPSLQISGNYSKSFRAPANAELYSQYSAYINGVVDNTPSGTSKILYLDGVGRELKPERARNLNISLSYKPVAVPGLNLTATYYRVKYTDRIALPDPNSILISDIRNSPPNVITRNPTQSTVDDLIKGIAPSGALFFLGADTTTTGIDAIVDGRYTNLSASLIAGFQISASYRAKFRGGSLGLSADVNHIDKFNDYAFDGAPPTKRVGTIFSPTAWRSRAGIDWSAPVWGASISWNYVDSYLDNRTQGRLAVTTAPIPVDAWNTSRRVESSEGRSCRLTRV